MPYPFETASDLPKVIDPDYPARTGMELGELGIRALAYGLTVIEALQQQDEHRRLKS